MANTGYCLATDSQSSQLASVTQFCLKMLYVSRIVVSSVGMGSRYVVGLGSRDGRAVVEVGAGSYHCVSVSVSASTAGGYVSTGVYRVVGGEGSAALADGEGGALSSTWTVGPGAYEDVDVSSPNRDARNPFEDGSGSGCRGGAGSAGSSRVGGGEGSGGGGGTCGAICCSRRGGIIADERD